MQEGRCQICGIEGPLSFEHVPPRAAFNDRPVILTTFEQALTHGLDTDPTGTVQQRGAGRFTLCPRCNNETGSRYGRAFVEWCQGGYDILDRTRGSAGYQIDMHDIYPLRVVKQIITMFFSVNGPTFAERYPDLVQFVLDKERKYLDPRYTIGAYFAPTGGIRHLPLGRMLDIFDGRNAYFSEIAFFPFGYVLTIDSDMWDRRLFDITHFSRDEYGERRWVTMWLPVLATHLPIPGDYRSEEQIQRQAKQDVA
jgi:hypothetical protein